MIRRGSERSSRDPLVGMIVHEDEDVVVVNKPQGMLTSSGPRDARPTLWHIVHERGAAQGLQMGIIHRLDRDASGLLVFSKNDQAYHSLKSQFFKHTVDRFYLAIVTGKPKPAAGKIKSQLIEWKDGSVHTSDEEHKGETAITHYEVCSAEGFYSLVRLKLETGRKHQIRVHLSDLGFPIVGDCLYGKKRAEKKTKNKLAPTGELMLVAVRLCFDHPRTHKRMKFEVDIPPHMRQFLRAIRPQPAPTTPEQDQQPKPKK